jgi:hypothetical protein
LQFCWISFIIEREKKEKLFENSARESFSKREFLNKQESERVSDWQAEKKIR